jgi:hypothetical protein
MIVPPTHAPTFMMMDALEAGVLPRAFWVSMKVVYESWLVWE